MRKRYYLILILIVLTISSFVCLNYMQQMSVRFVINADIERDANPYISINMENSENKVCMWQDEVSGKAYFFLPSCVRHHKIRFDDLSGNHVVIDGKPFETGDTFTWEEDSEYQVQIADSTHEIHTYELIFMKSDNIPAVFINTESGSMEYLNENKENAERGSICIVCEDGNTEYQGDLERISGHGNSTWEYEKKPYSIKLSEKYPLCGLDRICICRRGGIYTGLCGEH